MILEVKFEQLNEFVFTVYALFQIQIFMCLFVSSESIVPVGIVSCHPISGVSHSPGSQVCLLVPKLGLNF